jgi:hypothetical protein
MLDKAEQTMSTNPATAFDQLNSIDISRLSSRSDVIRWADLYGKAMLGSDGERNISNEQAQTQYIEKMLELYSYKDKYERQTSAIISLLMIIIMALFIAFQRERAMTHKAENEVVLTKASALRNAFRYLRMQSKKQDITKQFTERLKVIEKLCSSYYECDGTATEKYAYARKIGKAMERLKCDDSVFTLFEEVVNENQPMLLEHLKKVIPNIKDDDYRLFVYLACGVSIQTISVLTGESVASVYNSKRQLKLRISQKLTATSQTLLSIFG